MGEFRLRPRARADLDEIWRYTSQTWSMDQADAYIRELNAAFRKLADNSELGRSADDLRPGYRKQISGSHVIFYKATARGIDVVRVLHGRMNLSAHLT